MAATAAKQGRKRVYKKCQSHEAHRKAQKKYVAKDPKAQAARVKKSEAKHPAKVKAKAKDRSKKGGGTPGRNRSC